MGMKQTGYQERSSFLFIIPLLAIPEYSLVSLSHSFWRKQSDKHRMFWGIFVQDECMSPYQY